MQEKGTKRDVEIQKKSTRNNAGFLKNRRVGEKLKMNGGVQEKCTKRNVGEERKVKREHRSAENVKKESICIGER